MRGIRFFGGLLTSVALLATSVGVGFGLFYTSGAESVDSEADVKVDDIEENYALKDSDQSSGYYDVYFFPQEQAANAQNPESYTPVQDDASGYWHDSMALPEDAVAQNGDSRYGYRMITVYRSMSYEQFNTIGLARTADQDKNGNPWTFGFSGWTADKAAAVDNIQHRQGDFKYVDAFNSLTLLDQSDADGSQAGDHKIYLYPIYTTGKDYDQPKSNQQPLIRITDSQDPAKGTGDTSQGDLFFSQEGDGDGSLFYYNNLTVTESDITNDRYNLSVHPIYTKRWGSESDGWGAGVWQNYVGDLFQRAGTYNIKVVLYNWIFNNHNQNFGDYVRYVQENLYSEALSKKGEGVVVNYIPFTYVGDDTSFFDPDGISPFVAFIFVERVYEFRLLGGPAATFNYDGDGIRHFYDGNIYGDGYNPPADQEGQFVITYGLNNIYVDASGGTFTDTAIGNPEGDHKTYNARGTFKTNVFTIDAQNLIETSAGFWTNKFLPFTAEELASMGQLDGCEYHTISSTATPDELLQLAEHQTSADDTDWDYTLSSNLGDYMAAYRPLFKITQTGYYNFRISVTYDGSGAGDADSAILNHVESIKIAVAPIREEHFIKIFLNDSFNSLASGPFIDHKGALPGGNQILYTYSFQELGGELSASTVFTSAGGSSLTFGEILQQYDIYDHVTGERVTPGMTLDRNYVFYTQAKS